MNAEAKKRRSIERNRRTRLIGLKVRALRADLNLTQPELADKARVSRNVIARLETAATLPRTDNLKKIAGALGLEVRELTAVAEGGAGLIPEGGAETLLGRLTDSPDEDSTGTGEPLSTERAREIAGAITLDELYFGTRNLSTEKRTALSTLLMDTLNAEEDSYVDDEDKDNYASEYVVQKR